MSEIPAEALGRLKTTIIPALRHTRDAIADALDGGARYFRPSAYGKHYERFGQLLNELKQKFPGAFDLVDLPAAEPSGTTDFEGEGYLSRSQIDDLRQEITLALNIAERQEIAALREPKDHGFVAMAFRPEIDFLFADVFEPALSAVGLRAKRVDKEEPIATINEEILELIGSSSVVVADLTFERPSCYYEAGYAHALGRPVVLTAREDHNPFGTPRAEGAPAVHFDLASHKITYWSPERLDALRAEVEARLRAVLDRAPSPEREKLPTAPAAAGGAPISRRELEEFALRRLSRDKLVEIFPCDRERNEFRIKSLPAGELVLEHVESGTAITIPDSAVVHAHRRSGTGRGVLHLSQSLDTFE